MFLIVQTNLSKSFKTSSCVSFERQYDREKLNVIYEVQIIDSNSALKFRPYCINRNSWNSFQRISNKNKQQCVEMEESTGSSALWSPKQSSNLEVS